MSLYEQLGMNDSMSTDEMLDTLQRERQYWEDVRADATNAGRFYQDPQRQREEEESGRMLRAIDILNDMLEEIGASVQYPALAAATVCCAMDHGVSDISGFADSVVFVCTRRIFKSDYRAVMGFLESAGQKELGDYWRDFARYGSQSRRQSESSAGRGSGTQKRNRGSSESEKSRSARQTDQNSRQRQESKPEHPHGQRRKSGKSGGETLLICILVVMAVLVAGGAYLIYRARSDQQSTEEAAQAALSAISGSGHTLSGTGSAEEPPTSAAGNSGLSGISDGSGQSAAESVTEAATISTADILMQMADYTILSDPALFPDLTEISCKSHSATSELTGSSGTTYGTDNLFDDDTSTSWQEGEDGDGTGQSLTFSFDQSMDVKAIAIWAGNQADGESYSKNNRPSEITITITNGTASNSQAMTLDDIDGEQMIVFDEAIPTDTLTITIDGVYKGTDYDDTAISEMKFYSES